MIEALLSPLFAGAAIAATVVIARALSGLPAQVRAISAALTDCADSREVRFTIRTLDVVPQGGTVVRGHFSGSRRPLPQDGLPAAA